MVATIIIFQGLIFIVLIFVLRQFMKGHISGAVGHLETMNDELMKQQAELKQKVAEAETEYKSKMEKIQRETTETMTKARQDAKKTMENSRTQALEERTKLINEALQTREKMRQEVMAQMEEKAIFYSKEIITEFFSGDLGRLVHEELVKELIAALKDMDVGHFQIKADKVDIVSAEPLSAEWKRGIQKVLKEKIKKEVSLNETTDPSLVAGVTLKFGVFMVDGSLVHRLKEAAASLKKNTAKKYQGTI